MSALTSARPEAVGGLPPPRASRVDWPAASIVLRLFRYQVAAWVLLALLVAAALRLGIPRLEFQFGFQDIFAAGHPTRRAYESFERDFDLGQQVYVYVSGGEVFTGPFLEAAGALSAELEHLAGVRRVFSAVDLRAPRARRGHLLLTRILSDEVLRDEVALARTLAAPPFRDQWHGLLYDRDLESYAFLVTADLDDSDPRVTLAFLRHLEGLVRDRLAPFGVEVHLGGTFYVSAEMLRVSTENQKRLTSITLGLQVLVMTLLFGSLAMAIAAVALLAIAVVLGFGCMGALGIPMNFLSGNFPIMVLVIGTADLIHLLGRYCSFRGHHGPRGAALRAARSTLVPNLLTSVTTAGCLLVGSLTELNILGHFARALCLGVGIVYLVTIAYGPLVLAALDLRPDRGLYASLPARLRRVRWPRGGGVLATFGALGLTLACFAAMQTVDSNWFRNFAPGLPVSRSLEFLRSRSFPVATLDLTLPMDHLVEDLLEDPGPREDLAQARDALLGLPGVLDVYTLYSQHDFLEARFQELEWPASLAPPWRRARRAMLIRQQLAMGGLDPYFSRRAPRMRVVVTTRLESSRTLLRLEERILQTLRRLPTRALRAADFSLTGPSLYWSQVMGAISGTFLVTILGSLAVIWVGLVLVTRRPLLALLALAPNVLPLLAIFAAATLMGFPLSETMCLVTSISLGIAVDDTLHFLHHYQRARQRGAAAEAAVDRAMQVAAAPMIVTSGMLMLGYQVCLTAELVSVRNTGVSMNVSILVALLADLFLLPALLVRFDRDD